MLNEMQNLVESIALFLNSTNGTLLTCSLGLALLITLIIEVVENAARRRNRNS